MVAEFQSIIIMVENQYGEGLDYAFYITTAQEFDESLSGGALLLVKEAVSWSKVAQDAKQAATALHAEVTTIIICHSFMQHLFQD